MWKAKNLSQILVLIDMLMLVNQGFTQIQQFTEGKIIFERRTNLEKQFDPKWLDGKKIKKDRFELFFNDSISVFRPEPRTTAEENSWTTYKNTVVQNFNSSQRLSILELFSDKIVIQDSLKTRTWKSTHEFRKIAGHECRKVIWEKDDSTTIYAWYTEQIVVPTGPESFNGLPGAIVGLGKEDGSVVYFAKEIFNKKINMEEVLPKKIKKKDLMTENEAKAQIEKSLAKKESWAKAPLKNFYIWW